MKSLLNILALTVLIDLFAITASSGDRISKTIWLNDQKMSCSNVFITNGITLTIDGKKFEIGLREDGIVVWRHVK